MTAKILGRAPLRDRSQFTLPADVKHALHIESGDELEFAVDPDSGVVTVVGLKSIRADQAWFWTVEWQAKEAEAEAAIRAGDTAVFQDSDDFMASLGD
jgi:bifunctional DNA-binding transcriptional regulator/antitoxin component of YhaV-PrlF toxin-antitoxin module